MKYRIIYITFILLTLLSASVSAQDLWQAYTVNSIGPVGYGLDNSIAVDFSGGVHIAFCDYPSGALKYAKYSSGKFDIYTADNSGDVCAYASIAVDSSGSIHISHYDMDNKSLKYSANSTGSWVNVTVDDTSSDVGSSSSIAIDSADNPHISYYDKTNAILKYAAMTSGNWKITNIDTINGAEEIYSSIAVDLSGAAHISYTGGADELYVLKYATNKNDFWEISIPLTSAIYSSYTSIDADFSGNAHIASSTLNVLTSNPLTDEPSLLYVTNSGHSEIDLINDDWTSTFIDKSTIDYFKSLDVDIYGNVHISYYDSQNQDLKYSSNSSGLWETTTLVNDGQYAGIISSLKTDLSANAHVSFYWGANYDDAGYIVYANNMPKSPIIDIKADGSDEPIEIHSGDRLNLSLLLNPGVRVGEDFYYAALHFSDAGWESLYLDSDSFKWIDDASYVISDFPLFHLPLYSDTFLTFDDLDAGSHYFYFLIHRINGSKVVEEFYDGVEVTVIE
ncbi:hypothetical protein MCHI_003248 [Candidatus Magnetoovum chiemensis]|nr:hypothetical protein MCHI_003248 [Candidatus Magnetoovum chiemensis]